MKKLVMFLALTATAVAANAASLKWSLQGSSGAATLDGTAVGNATVYILMASTAADLQSEKAAILSALKSDASYSVASSSKYLTTTTTDSNGKVVTKAVDTEGTVGTRYYFAAVIQSGDYVYLGAPANNTGAELEKTVSLNVGATAMNAIDTASAATPGWYQYKTTPSSSSSSGGDSGAPEPTGGLLLAVGAGVLALRRKRA